jgi:hypothetical protein
MQQLFPDALIHSTETQTAKISHTEIEESLKLVVPMIALMHTAVPAAPAMSLSAHRGAEREGKGGKGEVG